MSSIRFDEYAENPRIAGNKAARLAMLAAAGFRVPRFFVVPAPDAACSGWQREVPGALRRLAPDGAAVAVRSSSREEDGSGRSFAGQFASFLDVAHRDVIDRITDVQRSAESERVRSYRRSSALAGTEGVPAVMVQSMVPAESAGVAFATDPVTGERDVAVIAAKRGLGDALVGGGCQGDTWRVDARGSVVDRELVDGDGPVLTDRQIRAVAELVRDVSRAVGRPQDIEWGLTRGRLYLLQSRDITASGPLREASDWALWDNSNIVESYGGVTTPLTFSVARSAYAAAYRHFSRVIGVADGLIRSNARTYEQMIGLIDGRVYYNLRNWYRLLMQTPGFRFNKRFMEQMMGVSRALPESALPQVRTGARLARARAALGMLRVGWRLFRKHWVHRRRVARFHATLERLLAPVEFEGYSLDRLMDDYDALQAAVIPAWDTPLLNDLYCMVFHGTLRKLCERWLPSELAEIHNELLSGEAGVVSLEPVRRMRQMAELAARDERLVALLNEGSAAEIERYGASCEEFDDACRTYLERFGDRCIDELKLESRTLGDDPLPMLRAVGSMARAHDKRTSLVAESPRSLAEAQLREAMHDRPIRRRLLSLVLGLARARVRDRENLRFERTRVYGRVRAIFVEIGGRLEQLGVIGEANDVFYLDVTEIAGFIRGTGSSVALDAVARARRREFDHYRTMADPPRRFMTRGPAQLGASRQALPETDAAAVARPDEARNGQACSAGIVRGPVRIVRDPRSAEVGTGDILVAERTDPGWVTIFPLVSGMIMERGSLLSHSAIVARELRLPCVVGVEDACRWLKNGDWVELDGATGRIRRLAVDHEAA